MNRFGESWLEKIRYSMKQASLMRLATDTQLEFGDLGFKACVLGSSAFMLLDDYSLLMSSRG